MPGYNFKAAQQRIDELKLIYRQMKPQHEEDGTWDWWIMAQIEEIEREMEEAKKSKMTVGQDGHPAKNFQNVITPMVPQWTAAGKEDASQ